MHQLVSLLVALLAVESAAAATQKHGRPPPHHHRPRQLGADSADAQTPFVRLSHPELMGAARVRYAPPTHTRPISALVLAEISEDPSTSGYVPLTPELIVNPAPRFALPGLTTLATLRKYTNTTRTGSAPKSYTTSSVSYTHDSNGTAYITEVVVNDVTLRGTFAGQDSELLPEQPWQPRDVGEGELPKTYADLIGDSFWFYEQQRSGLLYSPKRAEWRNNSGLHDGLDYSTDLTGGYYDAGDYLKFTHPLSAALSYLAYGSVEQWKGIDQSGQAGYLDQTLRWGFDWLIKAHVSPDHLFVQIGDTDRDNGYWGGDKTIPEPRPAYLITMEKPGTDVAAGTAAALAAGAIIYASHLDDDTYADTLLTHAGALYYFAERAPKALYQASVPAAASAYASTDYGDELVLGGLLLFKATSDPYYLHRADVYAEHYSLADQAVGNPVDWDGKHGLALLIGAQLADSGANTTYDYAGGLDRYVQGLVSTQTTPGGLLWFHGSSDDSSLVAAVNSAYLLSAYVDLGTSTDGDTLSKATTLAAEQLDYVLGDNPAGLTYVTGATAASPRNPQSAMASGGYPKGDIDREPEVERYRLYGALVGGPDDQDRYQDKRSNWRQSEIALDYNALWTPLLAREVIQGGTPFYAR